MNAAIIIATYGEESWAAMAAGRALPSAMGQGAYDVLCAHHRYGPIALARNELAAETDADWLCFLDADDELAPGYLDAMARAFEQERGSRSPLTALLLTPAVQTLRKHGSPRGKPVFFDRGFPLTDDNWLIVGTLIQRDLFMQVGGFSDYPHGFEDWSLWAKAWKAGAEIVKVPDADYRYWINPNSKHKQCWRDRRWQVETHNKIRAELFPELV